MSGCKSAGCPNCSGVCTNEHIAQTGGVEAVTLTKEQIPTHNHALIANKNEDATKVSDPSDALLNDSGQVVYGTSNDTTTLKDTTLKYTGGNGAHNNIQPSLALNFLICVNGVFPPRN